jgi:F-box-like
MSVSSISQSNTLGVDVLLMIFQQLEGEDLVKCEAVCGQWRDILLTGTLWKRLFNRNKVSLPLWRKVQRKLETNQLTLRTEQYRQFCRKILQVNRNWRTGNFTKSTRPVDENSPACSITMNDDYVAWELIDSTGCAFLDTESMEIKKFPLPEEFEHFNEMLVFWRDRDAGELEIVDPTNRWIVNALSEEEKRLDQLNCTVICGSEMLIFSYYFRARHAIGERIKIWKMGHPPILLKDESYENHSLRYDQVDERFIVATQTVRLPYHPDIGDSFNFISTKTLEETRSLSVTSDQYVYHRGLLFYTRNNGVIRILDVATGTHFSDLRLPFRSNTLVLFQLLRRF